MSMRVMTESDRPSPVASLTASRNAANTLISSESVKAKEPHHDIQVQLQYLKDDPLYKTVKPLQITPNFADREGKTNIKLEPGALETLNDVRGSSTPFSLDEHGFKYVKAPTMVKDWTSQPKIAQDYLPEMEQLLQREVEGCDEIMFYDARIRQEAEEGVRVQGLSYNPFARQVHTDNTERSVITKVHNLTDMKAEYLLGGRVRIINIWRPIKHPVYDCGLAIADGGKLQDDDVIECERHRHDTGEFWDTMGVIKYRPGFEWYYMSEQDEADVLLFKNYDSSTDVKARCCLHTAFDMPEENVAPNAPTRESIEVRALIFTYPANATPPAGGAMQHPLADSLKLGHLMSVDNEERSIADRPRTDIDEGKEMKDAELLLRRKKIRQLEHLVQDREDKLEAFYKERGIQKSKLDAAERKLSMQGSVIDALESQVKQFKRQLEMSTSESQASMLKASAAYLDCRLNDQTRGRDEEDGLSCAQNLYGPDAERILLRQTVEAQRQELQQWRDAGLANAANCAANGVWQASVDEAVRRERTKDTFVIRVLRDALDSKGISVKNLPVISVDVDAFSSEAEKDVFEMKALHQRLELLTERKQ